MLASSGDGLTRAGAPSKRTGQAASCRCGRRMLDGLHDARSASEGSFITRSVSNTARPAPGPPMSFIALLGVLARPRSDDFVDLGCAGTACLIGVVARVAGQVFAAVAFKSRVQCSGLARLVKT